MVGAVVCLATLSPLVGFLPESTSKSTKPLRVFKAMCGVLLLFGFQLFHSV